MYTVYDSTTGQILYTVSGVDETYFTDQAYVSGAYTDTDYYIDIGTKTPMAKSTQPSINHVWNHETKTWQLDTNKEILSLRQQRNLLLTDVDRVNPIRYETLTDQQRADLKTYRQALLDVPQQPNFPQDVIWPHKPAWL